VSTPEERKARSKAITAELKEAEHERLSTLNIRPYIVVAANVSKIAKVGGFDEERLRADMLAAQALNKLHIVHLNVTDVRAEGGLGEYLTE